MHFHHADKSDVLQLEDLEEKLSEMHERDRRSGRALTPEDLKQVSSAAILCIQFNDEEKGKRFERMSKYEQRLEQSVHRALRQLRQLRKDREKAEELPRSPFLDGELRDDGPPALTPSPRTRGEGRGEGPGACDCESTDEGSKPLSPTLSPEYREEGVNARTSKMKNEPTAQREDASGNRRATVGPSVNKNRITRPCSDSVSAPHSPPAAHSCGGSKFGRDQGRSSLSPDIPTPSRDPAIRP